MRITKENLQQTIQRNNQIEEEISRLIQYVEMTYKEIRIQSPEKQALQILKQHYFLQIPIPDQDFGGAIRVLPNGKKIFIINTAQQRVYQYFMYWHEIYHLLEQVTESHVITLDFDLNERKADYFAAQMLLGKDVYRYFMNLQEPSSFLDRIMVCIDMFKAPYKAVLIQLYEAAVAEANEALQKDIEAHFDRHFTQDEWEQHFKQLNLDVSLIQPSNILDMRILENAIQSKQETYPEVSTYQEHVEFLKQFIKNAKPSN